MEVLGSQVNTATTCVAAFFASPFAFHLFQVIVYGGLDFSKIQPPRPGMHPPPKIKLEKQELERPYIAWPTVILCLVCFTAWLYSSYLYLHGEVAWYTAWFVTFWSMFGIFTPLHDAVHGSVSQNKWINAAIGNISGFALVFGYPGFRFIHHQHHQRNCDHQYDPDIWCERPEGESIFWLPFRCLTVFQYYVHYFVSRMMHERAANGGKLPERFKRILLETVLHFVVVCSAMLYVAYKFDTFVLVVWVGPTLMAATWLMFLFDYVPHRPHDYTDRENPYKATHITRGVFSISELNVLMLYQNFHLVHHLWPSIPFYKMADVYWNHKEQFHEHGAEIMSLFHSPVRKNENHAKKVN